MHRRLVIAIAGAVAAAVAVVGVGTLVLTRVDARQRTQDELGRQIVGLAAVLGEVAPSRAASLARTLEPTLDVDSVAVSPIGGPLPLVSPDDVERVRSGEVVTGRQGDVAYAAAPLPAADGGAPRRLLLVTDSVGTGVGAAGRWFVVAGAVTVVLGGFLAWWLARSVALPLARAEAATRRIADGDLSVRVPEPVGTVGDDELARLVRSINDMAASLERSRGLEREFLVSISHDLRTPLTSIAGWAEALADGNVPDPKRAGATVMAEARRLDRLVRDLLDLARLRARAFALETQPVDLRDVAAGTAEGLRPDVEDAGLEMVAEVPDGPVVVAGDPDRLAQIAANLIENAARHARRRVHVVVGIEAGGATLCVTDDGPGIPVADRARVVERLHSTGGTGMGLAIVLELTRAMGGDLQVQEGRDGGARFVVTLPLWATAADRPTAAAPSASPPAAAG
ncbi:MAG: sensor histidine kinase [Acidimicrobiales bacterium]